MTNKPSIIVSTLDMDRISTLLEKASQWSAELEKLEDELDRATVMASSDMPSDVVTMNSTVCFKFVGSDNSMEKTLVYPDQVRSSEDISIFAPVGSALLGLSVGQQLTWSMPGGQEKSIEIIDVVYQPERAGDFHL